MARHVVARLSEIPPGGSKLVDVEGRPIGIYNVDGNYFALLDRCPHEGASLCRGDRIGLVQSDGPGHYSYTRSGEMVRSISAPDNPGATRNGCGCGPMRPQWRRARS